MKNMNSIRYHQLMKILGYKIPIQKSLPGFIESSLARVTSYLAHESKVRCLELFTPDVLYGYLRYHMASDFQQITFVQAVKDLKVFVLFLKNIAPRDRVPDSIYNFSLDTLSVAENLFSKKYQINTIAKGEVSIIQKAKQMKDEINHYINNEIMPMYHKFRSSKDTYYLALLDEKLEIIKEKLNQLRKVDPESAESLYKNKIRFLPSKEDLLDEYVKSKYGDAY